MIKNNFIVVIEETYNIKLLIGLKWDDSVTPFVPIFETAFNIHPRAPKFNNNFVDYTDSSFYKEKWERFFEVYLDKDKRDW